MDTQRGYWLIGRWKNIPVFFHWTILLWIPFYLFLGKNIAWIALSFPAFVVLLTAHEIGHAIAARQSRVRVESIRLYVMHGLCEHEHPYYESDHVRIAWGGVLAQFALLLPALALDYLFSLLLPDLRHSLDPVFFVLINANCVIAAINLIPVKPLDGFIAWRVIPLLRNHYLPRARLRLRNLWSMLNFRKRRAMAKESERLAEELINRLKNK